MNRVSQSVIEYQILLILLVSVWGVTIAALIYGLAFGGIYFDSIGILNLASLFAFAIACAIGLTSMRAYFIVLVFQIVAFPSLVDNFLPGVFYGAQNEIDASIAPLWTHIDVYIGLGILAGLISRRRLTFVRAGLLTCAACILFLSSIINLFYSRDTQDFLLIVAGFMHLRYLIEIYVLFSLYEPGDYSKEIVYGLIISVLFLFVEALVFTAMGGLDRLTSGTLGNNVFANLVASVTVYFVFTRRRANGLIFKSVLTIAIVAGFIIVVLSQTRMAVLSAFLLFLLGTFYLNRNAFRAFVLVVFSGLLMIAVIVSTGIYEKFLEGRFDVARLVSNIHINGIGSGKLVEIEPSEETNSLITRLKLYEASMDMIAENPLLGIGSMRWNYHKGDFGFEERILVDAHNGYLAVISQFGIPAILFIWLIYFRPIKSLRDSEILLSQNILLALISLGIAICDLSNAGIYKHQIYGLLSMNIVALIHLNNKATSN